jgi:hypothetical protein
MPLTFGPREGKIVRLTVFQTMEEAVEAVGLRG